MDKGTYQSGKTMNKQVITVTRGNTEVDTGFQKWTPQLKSLFFNEMMSINNFHSLLGAIFYNSVKKKRKLQKVTRVLLDKCAHP